MAPVPDHAPRRSYHHGDLRRALLDGLEELVAEVGPAHVRVRELARRTGVSHTAAAHHFRDKSGLLTAFAVEGHAILADALESAAERGFLDVGVAYVRFALDHPSHFAVMFRPELLDADDEALLAGRARAAAVLHRGVGSVLPDDAAGTAGIAAWSLVHGLATLHLAGALPAHLPADPEGLTRAVAVHLADPRRQA